MAICTSIPRYFCKLNPLVLCSPQVWKQLVQQKTRVYVVRAHVETMVERRARPGLAIFAQPAAKTLARTTEVAQCH